MIADDARLTPPRCKKHTAYDDTRLTPHRCKKHTASFARSTGKFPSYVNMNTQLDVHYCICRVPRYVYRISALHKCTHRQNCIWQNPQFFRNDVNAVFDVHAPKHQGHITAHI